MGWMSYASQLLSCAGRSNSTSDERNPRYERGERRRNDSGREAFRGCRNRLARPAGQPPALRAAPFVKGEYFRGTWLRKKVASKLEGSNLQLHSCALLPGRLKYSLSGW